MNRAYSMGLLLGKATNYMKNSIQDVIDEFDITVEQWGILRRLYYSEGYNQKELGKKANKDKGSLTRILDILEKKELIIREKSIKDRREYLIYLTQNGRDSIKKIMPLVECNLEIAIKKLSENDQEELERLLKKLTQDS